MTEFPVSDTHSMSAKPGAVSGEPERHRIVLPNDAPLEPLEIAEVDGGRLAPLIEALKMRLSPWLDSTNKPSIGERPPRIGLFGGLGQGKSTVVRAALHALERKEAGWCAKLKRAVLGPSVVHFDVSYFKADGLEWRFLSAVLWPRIVTNAVVLALVLTALLCVVLGVVNIAWNWNLIEWLKQTPDVAWSWLEGSLGIWWVTVLPLLAVIPGFATRVKSGWGAVNLGEGLFVGHRDWWTHTLARATGALPRVVVVDDLDRAQVDQQRAFLRAMRRFSQKMNFAVVVSMDESALLGSAPDPEAPEELLRKTIGFELRVPDRGAEDLALLAIVALETVAKANETVHPILAQALRKPLFVADFTRVLCLLPPPVSPRLVKRLLADTLLGAEQRAMEDAGGEWAWLSALLRLQALYTLGPELRMHSHAVCDALEKNRTADFEALAKVLQESKPRADIGWVQFLKRTRMMQPDHGEGWFYLINGMRSPKSRNAPRSHVPQTGEMAGLPADVLSILWRFNPAAESEKIDSPASRLVEIYRLFSDAFKHGAAGYVSAPNAFHYARAEENPHPEEEEPGPDVALPLMLSFDAFDTQGAAMLQFAADSYPQGWEASADQAPAWLEAHFWPLHVATFCRASTVERIASFAHSEMRIQACKDSGVKKELGIALLRERCSDEDLWAILRPADRLRLSQEAAKHRGLVTLIPLGPNDLVLGLSALQNVFEDKRALARWIENARVSQKAPEPSASVLGKSFVALQVWPVVRPSVWSAEGWLASLASHLDLWASLPSMRLPGMTEVPQTLKSAWRTAWPLFSTQQRIKLIGALVTSKDHGEAVWSALQLWAPLVPADAPLMPAESAQHVWDASEWQSTHQRLFACLWQWALTDICCWDEVEVCRWDKKALALLRHWVSGLVATQTPATDSDETSKLSFFRLCVTESKCTANFWVTLVELWREATPNDAMTMFEANLQQLLTAHPQSLTIQDRLSWQSDDVGTDYDDS